MKKIIAVLCILMIITSVVFTQTSAINKTTLFLDEEFDAQILDTNETLYYTFCAPHDGYYEFFSSSDFDLFVTVKDNNGNIVTTDDNSNGGGDFKATVYMSTGTVYNFEVTAFDTFYDGRFSVYIKESDYTVTKLAVTKLPDKTEYDYTSLLHDIDYTGLELTATMSDNSTVHYCYNTDGKSINGIPLVFTVDYQSSPAVVNISCGGATTSFTLSIIPSEIKSIELVNPQPVRLYENSVGYYDYEKDYFHYYYEHPIFEVLVTYKDGTQVLTDTSKTVDGSEFHFYDNQFTDHFVLGDNKAFVELMGAKAEYTVTIMSSTVDTLTLHKAPSKQYLMTDENYISYNEYTDVYTLHSLDLSGIEFTLYYNDSTQKTYTDADIDTATMTIDGERYYVNPTQITGVGTHFVSINYKGYDLYFPVRIGYSDTVFGDADNDHTVSVLDATAIQLHLSDISPLPQSTLALCDTDNDRTVSVLDATKIQMYLSGLIDTL